MRTTELGKVETKVDDDIFPNTSWTEVIGPRSPEGLNALCQAYRKPFLILARSAARRWGGKEEDAEELVQEFMVLVVKRKLFDRADPNLGKMRSYLLTAFKRLKISLWRKGRSQIQTISLNDLEDEHGDALLPTIEPKHEAEFYQRWANTLWDLAARRLAEEQRAKGNGELFDLLWPHVQNPSDLAGLADSLGMPEGTVKSRLKRLRERLRELVRVEVKRTLKQPAEADIDEEFRFIRSHLSD